MSRRVRTVGVAAGVAVLIGASIGITYAATASSAPRINYATACANTHHTLRLVDAKGACARGFSRVNLASAPAPLALNGTGSPATTKNVSVANFTVSAKCLLDKSGSTDAQLLLHSAARYVVQGTEIFTGNVDSSFFTPTGPNSKGAGQISFAATTNLRSVFTVTQSGGVTGNALIIQSGHTIAVTFALFAYPGNCSVQAQMTPSS